MPYLGAIAAIMLVRYLCGYASSQTAFFASSEVKKVLRQKMYKKLTRCLLYTSFALLFFTLSVFILNKINAKNVIFCNVISGYFKCVV